MILRRSHNRSASLRRVGLLTAAVLAASALGGCYTSGRSGVGHIYESTTWSPKTLTLVDTRTGETAWSVDVPVGQAIMVTFSEGTGPNEFRPDEIRWEMAPIGRQIVTPMNAQPCPPAYARRIDMTLRSAPEAVSSNPDPRWNERSDYEN
jgi:hypothetical protein